ncbi:hypothetical protein Pcinc_026392 [Petrolisthes cinctipes]|uniref:Corticotropin-releasing factor domain-containing protein n=1 Tax=Petrolisthes cinctipes TaxID=88211 RepID=A0AAE1F7D3_PETCI|nr:hypothetical protein Pcinc_026392 [Petrolisthes cinctipes]
MGETCEAGSSSTDINNFNNIRKARNSLDINNNNNNNNKDSSASGSTETTNTNINNTGLNKRTWPHGFSRRRSGLSLSIDASMKVLREALYLEIARKKQRQQLQRAQHNKALLNSIGKRDVSAQLRTPARTLLLLFPHLLLPQPPRWQRGTKQAQHTVARDVR